LKSKNSSGVVTTYQPITTKGDIVSHNGTTQARLGVGLNGQALTSDSTTATGLKWTSLFNTIYVIISDLKTSGTNGGSFVTGSWVTRTLNTLSENTTSGISISSNQITIGSGSYVVSFFAPGYKCDSHQGRFRNITEGTTNFVGSSENTENNTVTYSKGNDIITIGSSTVFELQHRCQITRNADGFGVAVGFGEQELYSKVVIFKIS
jgi:hypothetical protein